MSLLCVVLWPLTMTAQTATVEGIVTDPTGGVVPNASILATLESTSAQRSVQSDEQGRYRLAALPVGVYTIRCEKAGFQAAEFHTVELSLNQTLEQPVQLRLAAAVTQIDVRSRPEALNTTAATAGMSIAGDVLEETPSQNRSYLGIVLLAPAVAPAAGSNALRSKAGVRSGMPDSGFTFAGMRPRNNGLLIDGLDNRDETTGAARIAIGQEAVAEFRVTVSDVGPAYGGAAGGNLNVVTLSGTNKFHGDVNLFAGDSFLEARSPEAESHESPARRQYQPEAALNGPLRRNRTFFAATVEGEIENAQEFSEIGDPSSQARVNAALASGLFAKSGVHSLTPGLFGTASSSTEASLKLTQVFASGQQVTARYAFSGADIRKEVLGSENFSDESARGDSHNRDQALAVTWQQILNPHFINELGFQWARRKVDLAPNSPGAFFEIPGTVSLGQSPVLGSARKEDHLQVADTVTLVHGDHQWGFGATAQHVLLDARLANRFAGIFLFPNVAALASGTPDLFIQAFGDPNTRYATTPVAVWVQDQWKPRAGVTVIAGMRYEAQTLPKLFGTVTHNVAPRFGIAWQPGGRGRWVLRAGAGLFYDRFPLAFLNDAIQKDGAHGFEQYAEGTEAARIFQFTQGGSLAAPFPGVATSVYRPQAAFAGHSTYARKITSGVERALNADTTFTVEYMNIAGYHLPRLRNAALRLPPQFLLEQSASSRYQGVSVTLRRRFAKEFTYLVGYTGGAAYDDASDFTEQPSQPKNARLDWSRSRQWQAHRVVLSSLFNLPLDDWGAPRWLKAAGKNFALAPIVSAGSPRPVNALASSDIGETGAYPLTGRPDGLARNPFYERGPFNIDLRATKGFEWWKEHGIFLFGVGVYNLTNHTNAVLVSSYYGLPTYRGLIEAQNARQVQFSLQWEF